MTPPTLESRLAQLRAAAAERTPEEIRRLTAALTEDLERTVVANTLAVGEKAPDFTLRAADDDRVVWLAEELNNGPVVLSFYRGQWCPYCNLELKGMQQRYDEILQLGASVYFVGPETRDHASMMAEKTESTIPLLYDVSGEVMRAYRIDFTIPEGLRPMYSRFGFHEANPQTGWSLPIPATFVIAPDGDIVARHVSGDYSQRMEPADIISAVSSLTQRPVPAT